MTIFNISISQQPIISLDKTLLFALSYFIEKIEQLKKETCVLRTEPPFLSAHSTKI
jgi:hypothetical protein